MGLDYRGNLSFYQKQTAFNVLNQSLLLGVTQQLTAHAKVSLRQSVGTFGRGFASLGLAQTVPFDPLTTFVPATDFFDNRTFYTSTQADFVKQQSARLSYSIGGAFFVTRRKSNALTGVTGQMARMDVNYRVSRHTTVGALYDYTHFEHTRAESNADLHRVGLSYATALSRHWEISGYGAAMRMESKYVQSVTIDPVIAALLGITSGSQIIHRIDWVPNFGIRVSRVLPRGVAYVSSGMSVTPGNGLFLTSKMINGIAGYSYTGLRRWSFSTSTAVSRSESLTNVRGDYNVVSGTVSMSRRISGALHVTANYVARRYFSPDFARYDRLVHQVRIGFGFTPGDVPLRVW